MTDDIDDIFNILDSEPIPIPRFETLLKSL